MISHDYSHRRTGGGMSEHDFGETYTFLEQVTFLENRLEEGGETS
jgi:hypothetical protein